MSPSVPDACDIAACLPLMVVPPVYVLIPDSVTVPVPFLLSAPLPARMASITARLNIEQA